MMSMHKCYPGKLKVLSAAIMLAGIPTSIYAQDDDSSVEQIVVTGSYIRGTPLDAPSPVQVVDRTNIEGQGAAVVWDVIKNLNVNSGSVTNPGSGDDLVRSLARKKMDSYQTWDL